MRPEEPTPYYDPLLGVVFDLDGTLVESNHDFPRMRRTVIRIAERSGVLPGHLSIQNPIPTLIDSARNELIANGSAEGVVFRFEAEVNRAIDDIELEAIPRTTARTGALELLRALADKGFRLGVLTRSSEVFCRAALDRTQLGGFFPYLRTRSSPGPAKPSPEALRLLLNEMGVPRDRAALVGDHLLDLECARGAGVRFFAILAEKGDPEGTAVERFTAAGAKTIVATLPELGRHLGVRVALPRPAG